MTRFYLLLVSMVFTSIVVRHEFIGRIPSMTAKELADFNEIFLILELVTILGILIGIAACLYLSMEQRLTRPTVICLITHMLFTAVVMDIAQHLKTASQFQFFPPVQ